ASDAAGAGTLGELARSQAAGRANAPAADCYRNLQFSAGWAQRLPAAVPLYPDAQVSEAAGNDAPGCGVRIVSFASGAPLQTLVDYYYTHARRGGYSAQHQLSGSEHVLGGDKGRAAFLVTFRPHRSGGTDVDLVATLER
ncbi:MAG: hypothetical protein JWM75_572, partial [Sphingomonas bacterium]|nr:hypothetical protein [Sphingomonas bacterium]